MQLQYMRMLDQFQNGNLPLNLVGDKKGRKQKGIERHKDTSADEAEVEQQCKHLWKQYKMQI